MRDKSALNKGYILIEAVVAITIITTGLLGIFSLLSRSLSLNRVVADRYVAAYLSAEGVEIVKNIIDNNIINSRPWNTGLSSGDYEIEYSDTTLKPFESKPLRFDEQNKRYNYLVGKQTRFFRTVYVEVFGGGEQVKIKSVVDWVGRGGADFQIALEDRFFDWR